MSQNNKKNNKNRGKSNILWHVYSLSCSILIITVFQMMDLKALLKVQMGLLHPLVYRLHFELQGGEGLLHGGHPSLNGN
jgi:hypothetical protein